MAPRTIVVNPDTPGSSLSFVLPPGVTVDVESVYAAVDASGAGDTTGLLTVTDSSGVVIAKKRQGEVISGGTSPASATWALRLADDGGGSAPGPTKYEAFSDSTGVVAATGVSTALAFVHSFGDGLVLNFGSTIRIIDAGTYALSLWVGGGVGIAAYTLGARFRVAIGTTPQIAVVSAPHPAVAPVASSGPDWSITRPFAAGDDIDAFGWQDSGGNARLFLNGGLAKLA